MQDLHHLKTVKKIEEPPKKTNFKPFLVIAIIIFILFIAIYFLISINSFWDGKTKIAIASELQNGTTIITILDPQNLNITNIQIPPEVEVSAANNLGTWKLGSISKLGQDKNFGGIFLKNTIIKSFNYPIDNWSGPDFINLTNSNVFSIIPTFFKRDLSNLSIADRLKIVSFALSVPQTGKFNIDLSNTSNLVRAKLTDGSLGWRISGDIPTTIVGDFINESLSGNTNVLINDATSTNEGAEIVTKTIETFGANIASIQNIDTNKNLDCKITGANQKIVDQIANIFTCDKSYQKASNNFDLEIDIGEKFRNRF